MSNKVLVVDDEWMIARALSARLIASGFDVRTAADGMTGLAAADAFQPDIILLDLRMPDIDGFEVFRRLRADAALAHIPVIFLTANVQDTVRQEGIALGAAGFFAKPYDPAKLVACMTHAIASSASPHLGAPT